MTEASDAGDRAATAKLDPGHGRAALAILGAALLWSTGGLFIKLTPLGPLGVACGRSIVTSWAPSRGCSSR